MWDEIQDMPAEIFDISDADREEIAKVFEMSEEEYDAYWNDDRDDFNMNDYLNAGYDYWLWTTFSLVLLLVLC